MQRTLPRLGALLALPILAAALLTSGCAPMNPPSASSASAPAAGALTTNEFMIPSTDAGLSLYVRNKAPAGMTKFSPEKTVLFVHGATYPSETAFDLSLGGFSWMEYIASRGFDVYLVDVRGYGRSSRPAIMNQPANQNAPFANTEDAARDIGSAVDFILKRRGIDKLNLMGWSWGTTTTALYTSRNNDKIRTLVLYAPVWTPPPGATGPKPPTDAYRSVNMDDAFKRWVRGVPPAKQNGLIPAGWFDAWAKAVLESDPDGAKQTPPVVRAPNGVMVDILSQWLQGKAMYDAKKILVPTQIVIGEWDADTPVIMARTLFSQLTNVPYKSYLEVGEATHTLVMEKNRMQLIRAVQAFLEDPAPKE